MSKKCDLHIGDRIVASSGLVVFSGKIICGWSNRLHSFTERNGVPVDAGEFIAVKVDDGDRVRIRAENWNVVSGLDLVREAHAAAA